MQSLLNVYQHLPEHLNPALLQVGHFSLTWYGLMYLIGLAVVYWLLVYRLKKTEANYASELIFDLLVWLFIGLLIGGRLGYVLFYNLPYYLDHPLEALLPAQLSDAGWRLLGYAGMSYHGGLAGILVAGYLFCRLRKFDFWLLAEFVLPAIPAGYFFGRLGNFLNGELYGRVTAKDWGMYFPKDPAGALRHPSQLYEAFFEGLVMFIILWAVRNKNMFVGRLLPAYLFLYGIFRFFLEFYREPDPQIGLLFDFFSLGQIFSLIMVMLAFFFFVNGRKKMYNRGNDQ